MGRSPARSDSAAANEASRTGSSTFDGRCKVTTIGRAPPVHLCTLARARGRTKHAVNHHVPDEYDFLRRFAFGAQPVLGVPRRSQERSRQAGLR